MVPETVKIKGSTDHFDRSVTIGEEVYLVVEARVVNIGLEDAVLEVLDGYELGRGNDLGDRVLDLERSAFLRRDDDRKGRVRLPIGEKLEDEQVALLDYVDELSVDEDSGIIVTEGDVAGDEDDQVDQVDESTSTPHPDDPDFSDDDEAALGDFDPGEEPFPDTPPDRTDQALAEQHFAELDQEQEKGDAGGPVQVVEHDDGERMVAIRVSGSEEDLARIPSRLFAKAGPGVRRLLVAAVLEGKIPDIRARLDYVGSVEALGVFERAERDGKGRKGVLEAIGRRAAQLTLAEDPPRPGLPDDDLEVPEDLPEFESDS